MSLYDGIFFVILVGFMILGFVRGLLKEIAAILLIVVPMLAAVIFSPFLSSFLQKNTEINTTIESALLDRLDVLKGEDKKTDVSAKKEKKGKEEERKTKGKFKDEDEKKLNFKSEDAIKYLSLFTSKAGTEINEAAIGDITDKIVKSLAFSIIYFIFYTAIIILYFTLKIVTKIPVLSGFNRFFGAILGLCKAVLAVSILLLLIPALYMYIKGLDRVLEGINKSTVLKQLYENNIILILFKTLF